MRFLAIGVACLALAACQSDPEKKAAIENSPAGHTFAHYPIFDEGVTDVTLQIAWPTDYAWREDVNPFVPYIAAEAILSEGALGLSAQELLEAFNDKNAHGRIFVQPDYVIGELSFPIEHLDFAGAVAQEVLTTPTYSEDWLDRVKLQVAENNANAAKQDHWHLWGSVRHAVLGDTPLYNALTVPDVSLAADVTREDVLTWHSTYLTTAPTAIAIAGRITADEAGALIDRILGDLPSGLERIETTSSYDFAPLNVYIERPEAEKTQVGMLGPLPATTEGKDHLDLIALTALARPQGPMMEAIRTELRATYGIFAGMEAYDRSGRFAYIYGEVEAEKLEASINLMRRTYEEFRTADTLDGFAETRDDLSKRVRERVSYVDISAQTMLQLVIDGFAPSRVETLADEFGNVSEGELKDYIQEFFPAGDDLIVVAVGPDAAAWPGACVITQIEDILSCPR